MRLSSRHFQIVERLEPRRLLSATIVQPVPNATLAQDSPQSIDLANFFNDPTFTGTLAQITTSLGTITLELQDSVAPQTVANFLNYINSGLYNGTIVHRVVNDTADDFKIIQGGGFDPSGSPIPTPFGNVPNEPSLSNVRGTIAMAKFPNDPNSATSQWFINDSDNTFLDSSDGGFTVFGNVINGMNVVDEITGLTTVDGTALNPQFDNSLPVVNPIAAGAVPQPTDLVQVPSVSVLNKLSFHVSSTTSLITPALNGSQLTLTPTSGVSGIAFVTVSATDLAGSTVNDTFRVIVTPAANRSLDVSIGATHPRTVSYKEADGTRGTVTLNGPGSAVVHFGGDGLHVTASNHVLGANVMVMGIDAAGTTGASTLTVRGTHGKDRITTIGGLTTDGAFGTVRMIRTQIQSDVTIPAGVGTFNVDFARGGTINLGTALAPNKRARVLQQSWFDENLVTTGAISEIHTFNWFNSDDVSESIQTPLLRKVVSFGNFTPGLQLSGVAGQQELGNKFFVNGAIGGTWNVAGGVTSLKVGVIDRDFNGTFPAPIRSLRVVGNFLGSLTAPSIGSVSVKGSMTAAAITLTAPGQDLGSLSVRRGIDSSLIEASGSIGSISTSFLNNSVVYAGIGAAAAGAGLPATVGDVTSANVIAPATIKSISADGTFINSNIAASSVGTLSFGITATLNNGTPFGVATSALGKLSVHDRSVKQTILLSNVHDATTLSAEVAARHLVLNDLTVNLV